MKITPQMFVSVIIAAGGRGQRLGGARPKQLLVVGGRSILERTVGTFLAHPHVDEIVVALPADVVADPPPYLTGTRKSVRIVAGGQRRQDSVANAFQVVNDQSEVVVVHDAARPFASADLITRTILAAAESGAAVAAMQAQDTVKLGVRQARPDRADDAAIARPDSSEERVFVQSTLSRTSIYLAQTPQAFRRDVLRDALALSETGVDATDEASLAERAGYPVRLVPGERTNIKITTPEDLPVAETLAGSATPLRVRTGRAGTGYDLHRLVPGRPLVVGGVVIPSERGALGHSDADVVCHAVTDAILGAVGLGDIGLHFPDGDPAWKDASSLELLTKAVAMVFDNGFEVGNVDVTIILEAPRIRPQVEAMRAAVARAVGISPSQVSIKGKTNEGVDAVGRGEAIAAHAIALLRQR
jgi:2-C-methyl-D-erythritol 4-phosphate cytidylyltransferase/2-C-methyl-D-erythritol 2,4-cyclodiphosphate synthase